MKTRTPSRLFASVLSFMGALFAVGSLAPRAASAASMDPALARLTLDEGCRTVGANGAGSYYNPKSNFTRCEPDNAAFARLVNQLGYAFAPPVLHAGRTTGWGGFELSLESTFTTIDSGADYWVKGTQGPDDTTSNLASVENSSPSGVLPVYALKFRKGLPFGFEIASSFGSMGGTSLWVTGADVRWSLLEGFRRGIPSVLPDLAAGGSVRTGMGSDQLQLTVLGVDGTLSKSFGIGGAVVFTPYLGYQFLRVFGDSGLVDLTANTDAVNFCGYGGVNTPATPDATKQDRDGQPICRGNGTPADFNNSVVFDPVRVTRHRGFIGAQIRYEMFQFGLQAAFDLMSPEAANPNRTREVRAADKSVTNPNDLAGVPTQFAFSLDGGVIF